MSMMRCTSSDQFTSIVIRGSMCKDSKLPNDHAHRLPPSTRLATNPPIENPGRAKTETRAAVRGSGEFGVVSGHSHILTNANGVA